MGLSQHAARRETVHRLQVGFFGLGTMILLVGLASIIKDSAKDTQASAVPEAAPTVLITEVPTLSRDPLADAGVVPDLPAEAGPDEQEATAGTSGATPPDSDSTAPLP